MPSLATTTPAPLAIEFPSPLAFGLPLDALTMESASPSCKGFDGFGLNGQTAFCPATPAVLVGAEGWVSGLDASGSSSVTGLGATWICGSGMTCATAGLARSDA